MTMTRQIFAIIAKDLVIERRSKASLNALILMGGLILVVISFALGPDTGRLRASAGGVLWVAFAFAAVLGFARAYQTEAENRCFEGLMLAGADPRAIYLGKLMATSIVLLAVEATVATAMALLYGLTVWSNAGPLVLVTLLGTTGISSVGVLYGRLTMHARAREVMLPILVLPVVIPALLACVKATALILEGSTRGLGTWLELLLVFDVVFVSAGLLTYEALCRD